MGDDMFYKEKSTKETSLGKIPQDWTVTKLNRVARLIMGQSPPSSTYNKEGTGLPFLQGKMEFGEMYPSPIVYCSNPLRVAETNDVLISVRAPVGDVNLAPHRLCIGRGLGAIRFDRQVANHMFYFYYLQRIKSSIEKLGKGSTFKAIVKDDLESLNVLLPPYQEQQRVAEILSTVDETIQKTNEIISKTERLKKGLMQELLTKGIGHKEFKDTEIGRIPKNWKVDSLPNIMDIIDYRGRTPPFSERGIPYIGSDNIRDERIIFDNKRYVSNETYNKYMTRGIPKPRDILFTTEAPLGEAALIPENFKFCFAQRVVALHCKHNYDSTFFMYILRSKTVQEQLRSWATGTTAKGISSKNMKFIKIPYSKDIEEQRRIALILSTVDRKLELERKEKAKLEKIKQGLMDLLLTGKIRIKVD